MTSNEFIKVCLNMGYVAKDNRSIKSLNEWVKLNPKNSYTEEDFIEVHRCFDGNIYTNDKWRNEHGGFKSTRHFKNFSFNG